MSGIIVAIALAIAVIVIAVGILISRRKHTPEYNRMAAISFASDTDTIATIGISIICAHPSSTRVVESLLDTRYPTTEVVVAVNADHDESLLVNLRATYALVAVNLPHTRTTSPLRGLYRSRSRCFRRLVVADVATSDTIVALDRATEATSFDIFAILLSDSTLHPSAVGRMAVEIARSASVVHFEPFTTFDEELFVTPRHAFGQNSSFRDLCRRKNLRHTKHIKEILTLPMSENDYFITEERPTYNFLNILSLKIMKCVKNLLSLIRNKTER